MGPRHAYDQGGMVAHMPARAGPPPATRAEMNLAVPHAWDSKARALAPAGPRPPKADDADKMGKPRGIAASCTVLRAARPAT